MSNGAAPRGLACPACGGGLAVPAGPGPDVAILTCPRCGGTVRARRRGRSGEFPAAAAPPPAEVPPIEGLELAWRSAALRALEWAYQAGLHGGAAGMLAVGGFIPVIGGWLEDEINCWGDAVDRLGGVRLRSSRAGADEDVGPVLGRGDAPGLFEMVEAVARRLGARPPRQVRLTYLPCCGVTAWGRRDRALFVGLPLLDVLDRAELRAILAHELAHLAMGDAARAARAARFVEGLDRALDAVAAPSKSPLRAWARTCRRAADGLYGPVARGQEARADRAAATIAGGSAAASALVKVALVQPLFREVLHRYDPADAERPNLYAFFRSFWSRLPDELLIAMRHRLLAGADDRPEAGPHPALVDRLTRVQAYPDRPAGEPDRAPAASVLGDLEALEQMLHNRLFAIAAVEPSVFHRARS